MRNTCLRPGYVFFSSLNFAVLWLAPQKNWGFAVATNIGGDGIEQWVDSVASDIVMEFAPK